MGFENSTENLWCYELNCVPLKVLCWSSCVEGDGIWRWGLFAVTKFRWWGHVDGTLMMVLVSSERNCSLSLPCKNTVRRQLFIIQKESPHLQITLTVITFIWTPKPPGLWEINSCVNHSFNSILFCQPKLSKIYRKIWRIFMYLKPSTATLV